MLELPHWFGKQRLHKGPVLSQEYLNKARNWLKHWKEMKDEEYIDIELETQAIQHIVRAVTNLATHDKTATSETPRFFAWLTEHRKDLTNDLPGPVLTIC